jgi:DNA polymerase III subunit delta'
MRFEGFYGNVQAKEILSGLFDSRRIPHAVLIDGPHGSGKKHLARIIAAAAVCQSQSDLPCGVCRQCKNALSDIHPDIVTYAGTGSRSFGVDIVRKIRLDAYVSPSDAEHKVYILAGIESMTEQAQNALLKVLEEPPASVLFILTCDSRSHVLDTVRSRTLQISLGSLPEAEAALALEEQCEGISSDEALRAARISGGIVGRAKLILDAGFSEISEFAAAFTKAICTTDLYGFISLSGRLEKDGGLFTSFLDLLPALLRDAVSVRNGGTASLSGFDDEARTLSRSFAVNKLYNALLTALESQKSAERNANLTLQLTALFSQLWRDMHE